MKTASLMLILIALIFVGCQDASLPTPTAAAELIETAVTVDDDASQAEPGDESQDAQASKSAEKETEYDLTKIVRSDKEWRKLLSREQYRVTRRHGTERARSGRFWNHKAEGIYVCVCCDLPLFDSKTKFVSGTGWPSFYEPINEKHVGTQLDKSLFMTRTEVHCKRCDAHLGHVFDDGPQPTGLRYCINSASLDFQKPAKSGAKTKSKTR